MKKYLFLTLPLLLCAAAPEPKPCSKSTAGCASAAPSSPFLEASRAPQPAAAPVKAAPAAVKSGPAAAVTPVEAAPAPAAPAPAPAHSSPLWMLLPVAGVAGLYFYLSAGAGRKGRK